MYMKEIFNTANRNIKNKFISNR